MKRRPQFSGPRARRLWRIHTLRLAHLLESLPARARRELSADLAEHVTEILSHDDNPDEHARLARALERLGDPEEFLKPLVADAVFRDRDSAAGPLSTIRAALIFAGLGAKALALTLLNAVMIVVGAANFVFGAGALLLPARFGVFLMGPDNYQIRFFHGAPDDSSIFPWWGACLCVAVGAGLVWMAARWMRRAALAVVARTFSPPNSKRSS